MPIVGWRLFQVFIMFQVHNLRRSEINDISKKKSLLFVLQPKIFNSSRNGLSNKNPSISAPGPVMGL